MIWLGIDPGRTGALASVDDVAQFPVIDDLPITPIGRLFCLEFRALLRKRVPAAASAFVIVEALHARPGFDVTTQGELLRMAGAIEAIVRGLNLEYIEVDPRTWKRFYGLGREKRASVDAAATLYPAAGLSKVKDHNRAEALLLSHYGRRKYA